MEWGIADEASWWILARCGDCEAWEEIVVSNERAALLDQELDRQMTAMIQARIALTPSGWPLSRRRSCGP
jgi:hypothetical protein